MAGNSIHLTATNMWKVCEDFSEAVLDEKCFEKISYSTWKRLKQACESGEFSIEYSPDFKTAYVFKITGSKNTISRQSIYSGKCDDNSFGEYLCKYQDFIADNFGWGVYDEDIDELKITRKLMLETNKCFEEIKENENMKSFANFGDFGPVNSNMVRMSMYGMAVKNKSDVYVSYNTKTGEIFDVDIFNFNASNFLYKIPVAIKDIAVGDVVIHNRAPMFVIAINGTHKTLEVVDPINGERKEIILTKSPFGFDFATKVVNFIEGAFNSTPSNDTPFGNMWMYMMLGDNDSDMSKIMPLMMMANGGFDTSNPASAMMMMACMGNGKSNSMNDVMPLIAMSMMNTNACKCGGGCSCGEGKTE